MKLPENAVIALDKLTKYLLVKRAIGDKSEFLRQAGYTIDNWEQLERDMRRQVLTQDAVLIEHTTYGEVFEIHASLTGPSSVVLNVRTIWMQESGSGITKFITLYPDKGRTL